MSTAKGLDSQGNPVASSNPKLKSAECQRAFDLANIGHWPDFDWRKVNGSPRYCVVTNHYAFPASCGQRFGEAAPPGQDSVRCKEGRGAFATCRIAYLHQVSHINCGVMRSKTLFGVGCMGCGLSGIGQECCLRQPPEPQWVRDYFMERVPSLYESESSPVAF
jgi:hypothetical protein